MTPAWPYDTDDPEQDHSPVAWRNRCLLLLDRVQSPLAVCRADGTMLLANPAMAAEWALSPGKLPGRNALELFRPRETGQLERLTEALRLGRRSRYPLEVSWRTHGTARHGELTVDPVSEAAYERPALLLQLRVGAAPEPAADDRTAVPVPAVTPAEGRILALAAAGETTAAIAAAVGLTTDGVNYHLTRMARRWHAPNRTALVARAYVLGVLEPGTWPPRPATA